LALFHASNVFFEADKIFAGFGGVISQEFGKFLSVGGIFVDAEFKVLAELLIELLKVLSVFTDFLEEFDALFGDVFLDDFQDFVVLEIFSTDVERKIL